MLKYRMNTLLFESVEALIERVDGEVIPIGDIVLTNTITKKQIIIKNTPKNIVEVKKPISILDLPNEVMDVILNFANQKEYLIKTFINEKKKYIMKMVLVILCVIMKMVLVILSILTVMKMMKMIVKE